MRNIAFIISRVSPNMNTVRTVQFHDCLHHDVFCMSSFCGFGIIEICLN